MSSSCRRRPFEYAPRPSGRYDSRAKASFAACHAIVRSSILLFTCENKTFMSERTSSSSACTQLQPSAASPPSPAAHNPHGTHAARLGPVAAPLFKQSNSPNDPNTTAACTSCPSSNIAIVLARKTFNFIHQGRSAVRTKQRLRKQ